MSRCFPYPPPGYEKKERLDHPELLAKEKQKEEKHKKDKKEKEKKEDKERKDKDRSKDKHKEKKDRKERHKDKKKDKDRDKNGKRTSADNRVEEPNSGQNERKVELSIPKAEETKDSRFTEELARRITDEKGAANRMLENATNFSNSKVIELRDSTFTEEASNRIKHGKNGTASTIFRNSTGSIPKKIESFGAPMVLVKERIAGNSTIQDKERGNGNPMAINFINREQKRAVDAGRPVDKPNHIHQSLHKQQPLPHRSPIDVNFINKEQRSPVCANTISKEQQRSSLDVNFISKEQRSPLDASFISKEQRSPIGANFISKERRSPVGADFIGKAQRSPVSVNFISKEQRRRDGVGQPVQKVNHQPLPHWNAVVGKFTNSEQGHVDGIVWPVEKLNSKQQGLPQIQMEKHEVSNVEGKRKDEVKGADIRHRDRQKDGEPMEMDKVKVKNRDKEKKKEKKRNGENGHRVHDTPKGNGKLDQVEGLDFKPFAPQNNNANIAGNLGHNKKRKEPEMNGFLHDVGLRPNKLQRPATSSAHLQNGKTLGVDHLPVAHPPVEHSTPNNIKSEPSANLRPPLSQPSPPQLQPPVDLRSPFSQPSPPQLQPPVDLRPPLSQPSPPQVEPLVHLRPPLSQPSPPQVEPPVHLRPPLSQPSPPQVQPPVNLRSPLSQPSPPQVQPPVNLRSPLSQPSPANLRPQLAADVSRKSKSKAVSKPPHPDTKFLSQIYSVPKMDEWPDYDDQEWLFSSSDPPPKPKVEREAGEAPLEVWSEGLRIESADVFALPYVVPY